MIMKRFCHAILACGVFAAIVAAVSCTKDATGGGGGGYDGEPEVNHDMDGILRRNYLWNEEYATLSPDFGLPYDEFLDGVLMRMRTNDLDKKFRNGRWQLYSNIQRLSPVSRTALSADIDSQFPKEPVYGFGIVSLAIISYTDNGGAETGQYGFAVMAVYPDSPMARAGLGRGTIINQVDGQWITAGNLNTVYSKLLAPNGAATLSVADNQGGFGVSEHKLTAELIYENPVLYRDVLEYGEHKIGYLVYASFDAAFDGELLDALQAFKDAGINDLILDLRLNGGGYVMSSRMLASCIAGARCEGQVFQYYRYNDARMEYPEMNGGGDRAGLRRVERAFLRGVHLRRLSGSRPARVCAGSSSAVCHRLFRYGFGERSRCQCFAGNRTRSGAGRAEDQRQKCGDGGCLSGGWSVRIPLHAGLFPGI